MSQVFPWDLNPALVQDRLETLARIAVTTRNRAFAEADRAAGDTNWGLACKAHERLMHAMTELVHRGAHPWLGVVRDGLYLMPLIDGVPIRLFRGAADKPSARHLDAVRLEHERWQATAPQLTFDFMAGAASDGPWYWLMAMETNADGMVTRVVYFQANDAGETRHAWQCPLEASQVSEVVAPAQEKAAQENAAQEKAAQENGAQGKAPVVRLADKRGRRGAKPAAADTRQEGFWGALGAE